jgi:hypothetical protein
MDDKSRLQLQKMVAANNVEDQTDLIRQLKHSHILQNDINNLLVLKNKYKGDQDKTHMEAMNDCGFLFTYYTDIYNKVRKDEIDLSILNKFLNVLRRIEDGEIDQHDGAFLVGTLLKEMYVDSALKKADKLEEQGRNDKVLIFPGESLKTCLR